MLTCVSSGPPPAVGLQALYEANKVHSSGTRYVHLAGEPDYRGSVLSTRQRVNGHDTVRLDPHSEGSRTHIAQAVKAGLLVETAPGFYADLPST